MAETQAEVDVEKAKGSAVIDVKALINAMEGRFKAVPDSKPYTISRVPAYIRETNKKMYDPMVIAIGPYHHGRFHLRAMEKHKWRYLRDFLAWSPETTLGDCLTKMKDWEKEARSCYSDSISLSSDEFVEMMLLDAFFILELASKLYKQEKIDLGWGLEYLHLDLLLIENQIPFFIIQRLFDLVVGSTDTLPIELILQLYLMAGTFEKLSTLPESPTEIHHLLHLYHHIFVAAGTFKSSNKPLKPLFSSNQSDDTSRPSPSNKKSDWPPLKPLFSSNQSNEMSRPSAYFIPCATELDEAGVIFKKKKGHFLDITFCEGVMEIPFISIDDFTKPLFTNLIAFEQLTCSGQRNMTSYCGLIDALIDTEKDVAILQHCQVIENLTGSGKDLARFFNQLCEYSIHGEDPCFSEMFKEVNQYRSSIWHKHRARFCHDYFSNPWTFLSLVAAIVLLLLTFLQTFFATYAYFHPP